MRNGSNTKETGLLFLLSFVLTGLLVGRGKKSQISWDFQGQIRGIKRPISREFRGNFRGQFH